MTAVGARTENDTRPVYCYYGENGEHPHALRLELNDDDYARWVEACEGDHRLSRHRYGKVVVVHSQHDDHDYALRSAPCGLGCHCAAAALPLEEAGQWFVGVPCTLDGKDAEILGRRLDAGIVAQIPSGTKADFAWPTIARIMSKGGEFKS